MPARSDISPFDAFVHLFKFLLDAHAIEHDAGDGHGDEHNKDDEPPNGDGHGDGQRSIDAALPSPSPSLARLPRRPLALGPRLGLPTKSKPDPNERKPNVHPYLS
ncbi:hypothetical protein FB451DRAFT_1399865 [Mycena latifolia]|nr:hypothetical protein FB451DRAFT_1399865 [Mycena latifolia]